MRLRIKKQQFEKHIIAQSICAIYFYSQIVFAFITVGTANILYHITSAVVAFELP